jgi:hypothetical protein
VEGAAGLVFGEGPLGRRCCFLKKIFSGDVYGTGNRKCYFSLLICTVCLNFSCAIQVLKMTLSNLAGPELLRNQFEWRCKFV